MRSVVIFFILYIFGPEIQGNPGIPSQVVLYIFEGSDWCTNCARLERKILADTVFQREISLLKVKVERIDFPQRTKLPSDLKEYNDRIAEKFGFDGTFPTLIIFRTETDRSRRIFYHNESVEEMIQMIRNNLKLLYE
jgi:thiol-disulfide isomerase/thioredoxin